MTRVLYEAVLHIQAKKREHDFLTQAEELKSQTEVDKGTKVDLQDSFDAWVKVCDELDASREEQRGTRQAKCRCPE